jgi:hypothetical protein
MAGKTKEYAREMPGWAAVILVAFISFEILSVARFVQFGWVGPANLRGTLSDALQNKAWLERNQQSQSGRATGTYDDYTAEDSIYHFQNSNGEITWI